MKLTNLHIVVSSLAAIAGVAIAGYQAFGPPLAGQPPLQVTVALDPQRAGVAPEQGKGDGGPLLRTATVALEKTARVSSALKDGSDARYAFGNLFDGKPETSLTVLPPDEDVNVLVSFESPSAQPVTAIRYMPPPGVSPERLATSLDITVLPEGQLTAAGLPVISFTLQRSAEAQTFAIPGNVSGKGLWLRIAGAQPGQPLVIGDFSILREHLAP